MEGVAALRQKQTRDMPENRKCDSSFPPKGNNVTLNRFFDLVQWRIAISMVKRETFLDQLELDGNPGLLADCQLER